jgi:inosose dehydratase
VSIRFAINPIQWSATSDGWIDPALRPPLAQLLAEVRASGFEAVQAERPADIAQDDYLRLLAEAGLEPAPGYFSLPLAAARDEYVAAARAVADDHARLGLREVFVSVRMAEDRVAAPARGANAGTVSPSSIAAVLNEMGRVMRQFDVTPCLHPHVGSWMEVEDEIEEVVRLTDPALVALGPDTGHLAWAGVDPVEFTERHASRIRGLHLKDAQLAVARAPELRDADYRSVVAAGLWAEPGHGDLDLRGVLQALPATFDGWVVVEVDRPAAGSPLESARVSAEWVAQLMQNDPVVGR